MAEPEVNLKITPNNADRQLIQISCFGALVAVASTAFAVWARKGLGAPLSEWFWGGIVAFCLATTPLLLVSAPASRSSATAHKSKLAHDLGSLGTAERHLALVCALTVALALIGLLPMSITVGRTILAALFLAVCLRIVWITKKQDVVSAAGMAAVAFGLVTAAAIECGSAYLDFMTEFPKDVSANLSLYLSMPEPPTLTIIAAMVLAGIFVLRELLSADCKPYIFLSTYGYTIAFSPLAAATAIGLNSAISRHMYYDSVYAFEIGSVGLRHLDSAFHQAIVNGWNAVGYPSTGQDGYVFSYYHFVTHALLAGVSKLAGTTPENTLPVFKYIIVPAWFSTVSLAAVLFCLRTKQQLKPAVSYVSVATLGFFIAIVLHNLEYSFVSLPAIGSSILLVAAAPVLLTISSSLSSRDVCAKAVVLFLAGTLAAFAKVSSGYFLLAATGWALLVSYKLRPVVLAYAVVSISILIFNFYLFAIYYPPQPGEGSTLTFDFSYLASTFPYPLIVVLLLIFFSARTSFLSRTTSWIIVAGWIAIAILPQIFLRIDVSDRNYFAVPGFQIGWIALAVVTLNYLFGASSERETPITDESDKLLLGADQRFSWTLLLMIIFALQPTHTVRIALSPSEAISEVASHAIAAVSSKIQLPGMPLPKLDETKPELAIRLANAKKFVVRNIRKSGFPVNKAMAAAAASHPVAALFAALKAEIKQIRVTDGIKTTAIFLPKGSWTSDLTSTVHNAHIAMNLFAYTKSPLLWGFDPDIRIKRNGHRYGWLAYERDSEVQPASAVDDTKLCSKARENGMHAVIVINNLNPVQLRSVKC